MRNRVLLPLLAIFVLLVAGTATLPARAQSGPNLLENPGFEAGHYNQDGIPQITVPNGWRMYWSNDELIFGGEWVTTRPETVVWNIKGSPPGEEFYWKDGSYTVKVFNSWAPLWAAMAQDVEGLQVGRRYRLAVPVYVDVFADYEGGQKIAPPPEHKSMAKVRLGAGPVGATWRDENAINYSGWWTADTINPFYQAYPIFVHEFTATQPNMTVYIEMASAYPFPHNGFFFDTPSLVALDATGAVAPQPAAGATTAPGAAQPAAPVAQAATIVPPTPRPDGSIVHVVQQGDTLWVIAINYAATLGLAPLDALAAIQELNNNPTFLNPGDEILIKAGTGEAAPEATTDPAATVDPAATIDPAATVDPAATPDATAAAGVGTVSPDTAVDSTTDGAIDAAATTPEETAAAGTVAGAICVGAFHDANGDGQRNEDEPLVANAAIAIARAGTTVSTYITDGATEPHCFELTEADSYQLQLYPPAGFAATTEDNWAVSIASGESYTVFFGLSDAPASADTAGQTAGEDTAVDASATEPAGGAVDEAAADEGGLFSGRLGIIVMGAAGFLLVLAALGVYLLRRG